MKTQLNRLQGPALRKSLDQSLDEMFTLLHSQ